MGDDDDDDDNNVSVVVSFVGGVVCVGLWPSLLGGISLRCASSDYGDGLAQRRWEVFLFLSDRRCRRPLPSRLYLRRSVFGATHVGVDLH